MCHHFLLSLSQVSASLPPFPFALLSYPEQSFLPFCTSTISSPVMTQGNSLYFLPTVVKCKVSSEMGSSSPWESTSAIFPIWRNKCTEPYQLFIHKVRIQQQPKSLHKTQFWGIQDLPQNTSQLITAYACTTNNCLQYMQDVAPIDIPG